MSNPFATAAPTAPAQAPVQAAPAQAPAQPQFAPPAQAPAQAPVADPWAGQPTFQAPPANPAADQFTAPASTQPEPAAAPAAAAGDPFAAPAGVASVKCEQLVGELVLVKPEEFIAQMSTDHGPTDAVSTKMAILSNVSGQFASPYQIEEGMIFFQRAIVRDLKKTMEGPQPFLLGTIAKGEKKANKSAPYIFREATEEQKNTARQFLAAIPF